MLRSLSPRGRLIDIYRLFGVVHVFLWCKGAQQGLAQHARDLTDASLRTFAGHDTVTLHKGSALTLGPSRSYAALDWLSATMSAVETRDLTDPGAWTLSAPAATPAALHALQLQQLLGIDHRADEGVLEKLLGGSAAAEMAAAGLQAAGGVGGLYAMEGVPVREQHAGGSGLVRSLHAALHAACAQCEPQRLRERWPRLHGSQIQCSSLQTEYRTA